MSLLLTVLIVLLSVAIVLLVTWEIIHRRSPFVKRWSASTFPGRVSGLGMLEGGTVSDRLQPDEPEAIVLLHGLGATADYFGDVYEGLANTHRLVMPDLLGFGRSLDEQRTDFSLDAHVRALDAAITSLGLVDARITVAAHSMGSAVALEWARRHPDRAISIVLWGPPVYASDEAAAGIGEHLGAATRMLVGDTEWSRRLCRLNCAHRRISGWLMAAIAPKWPTGVSSRASLHTWSAYRGSVDALIMHADWPQLFDLMTPVTVFRGENDEIGDRTQLAVVARRATIIDVPGAGHHLAITHPELLFDLLDG